MVHAWHDVSPGDELPRDFQAVIEIPLGSNVKYELDKTTGLLKDSSRRHTRKTTIRWTYWFSARSLYSRWH
jgi:inorganic pyrophosphatase